MRKNFILFITILILIPTFVVSIIFKSLNNDQNKNDNTQTSTTNNKITTVIENKKDSIKIKINKNNEIQELNLEDYIVGVVAGEMPASFNIEALKAQAVASRTYAMYKMNTSDNALNTTTDDQVYITLDDMKIKWENDFDEYYNKIKKAVNETNNQVMKQNNELFKAFYFAMSNGYTEDSAAVFGETNLESVSSPWDNESLNKFIVETTFTKEELKQLLNLNDIEEIKIISRDKTNRVSKLSVNNKTYTGVEFRKLLTLRSTDFTIKEENDKYIITTKGYGHGVGMSQYGANGMANENFKYEEILKYYYKDIEICEI